MAGVLSAIDSLLHDQVLVESSGLQEDQLQPVLDSLSQLLKDSNHKVPPAVQCLLLQYKFQLLLHMKGVVTVMPWHCCYLSCSCKYNAGVPESRRCAACCGPETGRGFVCLRQWLLVCSGKLLRILHQACMLSFYVLPCTVMLCDLGLTCIITNLLYLASTNNNILGFQTLTTF